MNPLLFIAFLSTTLSTPTTNLPDVPPGVFNVSASILIHAPLNAVRHVLLDFPSYPSWNPFVRLQVLTDEYWSPLPDANQSHPRENIRTVIYAQIPPVPPSSLAISSPTPTTITVFDNITHVDSVKNRWAWCPLAIGEPPPPGSSDKLVTSLDAERWTALSVVSERHTTLTLYESREVYRGPMAYFVRALYGSGLQQGFDAMAIALKKRAEETNTDPLVLQSN